MDPFVYTLSDLICRMVSMSDHLSLKSDAAHYVKPWNHEYAAASSALEDAAQQCTRLVALLTSEE